MRALVLFALFNIIALSVVLGIAFNSVDYSIRVDGSIKVVESMYVETRTEPGADTCEYLLRCHQYCRCKLIDELRSGGSVPGPMSMYLDRPQCE